MTKTEQVRGAIALLQSEGWTVSPPPCPACHGNGFVMTSDGGGSGQTAWGSVGNAPCPRGCPPPRIMYNGPRALSTTDTRAAGTRTHPL